jgi:hypothetical protein
MALRDYLHPEFGIFCLTPRLRRDLRVASVCILVGAIAGAVAMVVLNAGGERNAQVALTAPVASLPADAPSAPEQLPLARTEGTDAKATKPAAIARVPETSHGGKLASLNDEPVAASAGMGTPSSVAAITPDESKSSTPGTMQPRSEAVPGGTTGTPSEPKVAAISQPSGAISAPRVVVPKKSQKTARVHRRERYQTGDDHKWRGRSGDRGIGRYAEPDRRGSFARAARSSTSTIFWTR